MTELKTGIDGIGLAGLAAPARIAAAYGHWAGEESDDSVLGALRVGHKHLSDAFVDIVNNHARTLRNPLETDSKKLLLSGQFAKRAMANAARSADVGLGIAQKETADLNAEIERALLPSNDPAAVQMAGEIRSFVRNRSDKGEFLLSAARRGDLVTLRALLHAPAFLLGLEPATLAAARKAGAAAAFPEKQARLVALDAASIKVNRAATMLRREVGQLIDFKRVAELERFGA